VWIQTRERYNRWYLYYQAVTGKTSKKKNLYYAFVDLEKAFDRVPRDVTRWALRKSGVEEWLVSAVMAMYEGAKTVVRTDDGDSESFAVKVGLHQGSVLSPAAIHCSDGRDRQRDS
jgi:hypothetical protein